LVKNKKQHSKTVVSICFDSIPRTSTCYDPVAIKQGWEIPCKCMLYGNCMYKYVGFSIAMIDHRIVYVVPSQKRKNMVKSNGILSKW
jgi:hypothetical protein